MDLVEQLREGMSDSIGELMESIALGLLLPIFVSTLKQLATSSGTMDLSYFIIFYGSLIIILSMVSLFLKSWVYLAGWVIGLIIMSNSGLVTLDIIITTIVPLGLKLWIEYNKHN
jgi:predicted Na+-dependent transporter